MLDLGVKDRFDQFKRQRHSTSQMYLPITRQEKGRVIRDIMIPRVFASDRNSTFGLFLFSNTATAGSFHGAMPPEKAIFQKAVYHGR